MRLSHLTVCGQKKLFKRGIFVQAILNVGLNIPGTAFIAMPASPLIVWGFTA